VHSLAQPVCRYGVVLCILRIEIGGEFQPRQDFAHLITAAEVIVWSAFVQMRVAVGEKMTAKGINPVAR
jgi:hypothetical protein